MRTRLPFLLAFAVVFGLAFNAVAGLNGTANKVEKRNVSHAELMNKLCDLQEGNLSFDNVTPDVYFPDDMSQTTLSVPIGQSGNLYTILIANNMVDADEDLNAVVFIHRGDPGLNPDNASSTSNYNVDISTTGGNTWIDSKVNVGPINSTPGLNEPNGQGRYPQVAIYNPAGNTDPNAAYAVFMGATHDGVSANVWDGYVGGSLSLSSSENNIVEGTETAEVVNYGNVVIPESLVERVPGEYNNLDWEFNGTDFDELVYYSISTDGTTTSFSNALVPMPHDEAFDGTSYATLQQLAWDATGQEGMIMFAGDIGSCTDDFTRGYAPAWMRTEDGGATWSDPATFKMTNFDGFVTDYALNNIDTLGTQVETGATVAFYDADAAIDANGDFYYLCAITARGYDDATGEASPYTVSLSVDGTVTPYCLAMVHWSKANGTWDMIKIAELESPTSQDFLPDFANEYRCQLTASPDRTKLFVTYLDAPVDSSVARPYRDLRGVGFDVATGLTTPVKDFTFGDPVWGGNALFHCAAPNGLIDGNGDHRVPSVFTQILTDDLSTVQYHYIRDVIFSDAEFTETPEISNYTADPATADSFTATPDATVSIEYTFEAIGSANACGYSWDFGDGSTATGQSATYTYDNLDGTYNVCVTVTNDDGGETICQDVTVSAFVDTEPPVITLLGENPFTILQNQTFNQLNDPGYTVSDNFDAVGDIDVDVDYSAVDGSTLGTYDVTYTATDQTGNPATAIREVTVIEDTSIDIEALALENINLFPNPTEGLVSLSYPELQVNTIAVYNVIGELMIERDASSTTNMELDLSTFDEGMYIISLQTEQGVANKKVTLSRD